MRRYFQQLLAILLTLAPVSLAVAQSQTDLNTTSAGTISGHVVDYAGQPLAYALVGIRPYGGGQSQTTTTDSNGRFQVSGLTPAAYIISASFPGYVSAPRDADINPIGYYLVGDSVRLEMIKGGVITGTVTRLTAEPIVAVPVRAYMILDGKGQRLRYGIPFRQVTTDDRGVYRIYGLPVGTYVVAAGGASRPSAYGVDIFETDTPTYFPSSTRDTATEINVRYGEETPNVDIRYRGEAGHAVSGTARNSISANQAEGFNITLSSIFNGESQASYASFQPPGARGFSFYGVADGDYDVIAQSYLPSGEWVISEARRIKVKGADVTGIELTARPLATVTGHVGLEESKASECTGKRRPLFAETVIGAWHNEKTVAKDQPEFVWGLGGTTVPDKLGDFTLRNLAAGQYRFNTRPMSKYWYLKSISWPRSSTPSPKSTQLNLPADAARNWTTLKAGDRFSGLTFVLAEGAASLKGQVDVGEGQQLPSRLFAYLLPAERERAEDILRFNAAMVSADGTFSLNNLSPGRYWLIVQPVSESETNILSKLRLPDETETRGKLLHNGEAAKIEIELKPCQNVTDYHYSWKPSP